MTDLELLQEYVDRRSEEAFATLVRRHIDWVHSAAGRRLGGGGGAEDVTQAVFVALVRRATGLAGGVSLPAWLLRVTRYAAVHARRDEARRKHHEREAAMMKRESTAAMSEGEWEQVAPMLDELVGKLGKKDQEAVLLRFYQQKSLAEVGQVMGISEKAATKRVQRAVEKLRGMFERRGVAVASSTVLAAGMGAYTTQPAGAALVAATTQTALAAAQGGVVAGNVLAIAKGAMNMMLKGKLVSLSGFCGTLLLILAGGTAIMGQLATPSQSNNSSSAVSTASENPDPLAEELLSRAERASAWVNQSVSTIKLKWQISYESGNKTSAVRFRSEHVIRRYRAPDGRSHFKIDQTQERNGVLMPPLHTESILMEKQHVDFIALADGRGSSVHLDREPGDVEVWRKIHRAGVRFAGFLDGMATDIPPIPDGVSVLDVARSGHPRLLATPEAVDGIECRVVESDTPSGHVRIWIAESKGDNIAKFSIDQQGVPGKASPEYHIRFDQAKFVSVGDHVVIAGGHFYDKHAPADGNDGWTQDATADRVEIDLQPRFGEPGVFTPAGIPEGSSVTIRRMPDHYVWKQGKAILETPEMRKARQESEANEQSAAMDALVGQPAPEFPNDARWVNGPPLKWSDLRGKVVLLDFWSITCGPCRRDLPVVNELHSRRDQTKITVLGIHASGASTIAVDEVVAREKTRLSHLRQHRRREFMGSPVRRLPGACDPSCVCRRSGRPNCRTRFLGTSRLHRAQTGCQRGDNAFH